MGKTTTRTGVSLTPPAYSDPERYPQPDPFTSTGSRRIRYSRHPDRNTVLPSQLTRQRRFNSNAVACPDGLIKNYPMNGQTAPLSNPHDCAIVLKQDQRTAD